MTFKIKQNGEFITLNSFDEQYCAFTGKELRSNFYGEWFSKLEDAFYLWDSAYDSYKKGCTCLYDRLDIDEPFTITAKSVARCLIMLVGLNCCGDIEFTINKLKDIEPIVKFFDSLEDTTFYFSF